MKLELGTLGTAQGKIPSSLATCWDFVGELGRDLSAGQTYHLHAAAIGAANQSRLLPKYPYLKGDPVGYGYGIFKKLLEAGLNPAQIIDLGAPILAGMVSNVSGGTKSEVQEKEDFS
jgi:hypothetical protein